MAAQNIAISIFSVTAGTQLNVLLQQCVITRVSNNSALPKGYYHMVVIAVQDCNTSYRRIISIKFCQTFSILEFLNRRKHDIITLPHLHSFVPIISLHSCVRALKCCAGHRSCWPCDATKCVIYGVLGMIRTKHSGWPTGTLGIPPPQHPPVFQPISEK